MTDDLVQRLRRTYRKEFPVTGSMIADNSTRLRPFPILATEVMFNPDGREAADRIEAQAAEIEQWRSCARYDAMMEGPAFKGWDMSALERCRRAALQEQSK
jgi:hypothetical protein